MIITRQVTTSADLRRAAEGLVTVYNSLTETLTSIVTEEDLEKRSKLEAIATEQKQVLGMSGVTYDPTVTPDADMFEFQLAADMLRINETAPGVYHFEQPKRHIDFVFDSKTVTGPDVAFLVTVIGKKGVDVLLKSALVRSGDNMLSARTSRIQESSDPSREQIATIGVDSDGSTVVHTTFAVITENLEKIQGMPKRSQSVSNVLANFLPGLAESIRLSNLKMQMIDEISLYDSVSSLEKQVDLLSNLVVTLIQANPSIAPSWFDEYVKLVVPESTEVYKTAEELVLAVAESKSFLRAVQRNYIQAKKGS